MKHLVVYINKADAVDDAEVLELVSNDSCLVKSFETMQN